MPRTAVAHIEAGLVDTMIVHEFDSTFNRRLNRFGLSRGIAGTAC